MSMLGQYMCLKQVKCVGNWCRGCVVNTCHVNGEEVMVGSTEKYLQAGDLSHRQLDKYIPNVCQIFDNILLRSDICLPAEHL